MGTWSINPQELNSLLEQFLGEGCRVIATCSLRVIAKLGSSADAMDGLVKEINEVYSAGAVEGYSESTLTII